MTTRFNFIRNHYIENYFKLFQIKGQFCTLRYGTLKVDILNPKARKLLKDLTDLNLIAIRKSTESEFSKVLKRIRTKSENVPTPDELADEVEAVRSRRIKK